MTENQIKELIRKEVRAIFEQSAQLISPEKDDRKSKGIIKPVKQKKAWIN